MAYFTKEDVKLHYEQRGNWDTYIGYPILLLHGNNEDMSIFDSATKPLYDRHAFLAVDSRGQGASTILSGGISYEAMAKDTYSLLEHLSINICDVVGYSDGGIISLILAKNRFTQQKIGRMIVIGANLFPSALYPVARLEIKREINKLKKSGDKLLYDINSLMLNEPNINPDELSSIYSQTAVVAGEKDVVKREHTDMIAKRIMRSKQIIVKGAGHDIPTSCPDTLRRIICDEFGG